MVVDEDNAHRKSAAVKFASTLLRAGVIVHITKPYIKETWLDGYGKNTKFSSGPSLSYNDQIIAFRSKYGNQSCSCRLVELVVTSLELPIS